MEPQARSAQTRQARRRRRRLLAVAALLATIAAGCGAGPRPEPSAAPLVSGRAGPAAAPLAGAADLARRFATAYAAAAYLRRPPPLPGTTAAVGRALRAAAARVPRSRRRLRPRALGLDLEPLGAARLGGRVRIGDGRSPAFEVGFTVARRDGRWRVVSVSLPG